MLLIRDRVLQPILHLQVQNNREDRAIDYLFRLLDISAWYYVIALLLGVATWQLWKKSSLGLLVGYAFFLLAETVLIRHATAGAHFQPQLFWSWREWEKQKNQILTNILMFIPVGVLAGRVWKWRGMWVAAGMSCSIEILQLVSKRGLCEFDDVFHNVLGAVIGICVMMVVDKLSRAGQTQSVEKNTSRYEK